MLHILPICSAKLPKCLLHTTLPLRCGVRCASSGRTSMTPVDADGRRWRRRLTLSLLPSRRTGDIRVHRRLGRTPGATGFVGHRPTWSPLHREIPEGNRRVQHGVEHELINVAGKAIRDASSVRAPSASRSCLRWRWSAPRTASAAAIRRSSTIRWGLALEPEGRAESVIGHRNYRSRSSCWLCSDSRVGGRDLSE